MSWGTGPAGAGAMVPWSNLLLWGIARIGFGILVPDV